MNRRADDPRRPPHYHPLDSFWQARGYSRQDAMTVRLRWKELQAGDAENSLTVWMRRLAR